jgi:hypothetical protein
VLVKQATDPADFLAAAGPFLLEDEARHNLILGITGTLRDRPATYPAFHLWLVSDGDEVVAAALQTPPLNLVLTGKDAGVAHLADALADDRIELPGVTGAVPEVDTFARRWEALANVRAAVRMRQRIYGLTRLRPVAGVSGAGREATDSDRDLLVAWVRAFADESLGNIPSPASDAERTVDLRLHGDDGAGFILWQDEKPVSLAGWGGMTPNGIRIGPVYTPPEHRRRGYGSAVTAAVSARHLSAGRQFCFLYTDLENPTSNKIYVDIGFEPVCDSVDYAFERGS